MILPSLTVCIALPLLGGVIGYLATWLAIRMIFGVLGRRQRQLAQGIGRVAGGHLLGHEDVVRALQRIDLEKLLGEVLEPAMASKVDELRALPLIGGFLTSERVGTLRESIVAGILEHRPVIQERLEQAVEAGIDVRALVAEKIASFPVGKLEQLVYEVAGSQLRGLKIMGGLLGVSIGALQVLVVALS